MTIQTRSFITTFSVDRGYTASLLCRIPCTQADIKEICELFNAQFSDEISNDILPHLVSHLEIHNKARLAALAKNLVVLNTNTFSNESNVMEVCVANFNAANFVVYSNYLIIVTRGTSVTSYFIKADVSLETLDSVSLLKELRNIINLSGDEKVSAQRVSEIKNLTFNRGEVDENTVQQHAHIEPDPILLSKFGEFITSTPLFSLYLNKAIDRVNTSAKEANVSPKGFSIDDSYCDYGEILTSALVDTIEEWADHFNTTFNDPRRKFIINLMCGAVTEHFAK